MEAAQQALEKQFEGALENVKLLPNASVVGSKLYGAKLTFSSKADWKAVMDAMGDAAPFQRFSVYKIHMVRRTEVDETRIKDKHFQNCMDKFQKTDWVDDFTTGSSVVLAKDATSADTRLLLIHGSPRCYTSDWKTRFSGTIGQVMTSKDFQDAVDNAIARSRVVHDGIAASIIGGVFELPYERVESGYIFNDMKKDVEDKHFSVQIGGFSAFENKTKAQSHYVLQSPVDGYNVGPVSPISNDDRASDAGYAYADTIQRTLGNHIRFSGKSLFHNELMRTARHADSETILATLAPCTDVHTPLGHLLQVFPQGSKVPVHTASPIIRQLLENYESNIRDKFHISLAQVMERDGDDFTHVLVDRNILAALA